MRLGEYHELRAVREGPPGLFLSDGQTDVLLPKAQVPPRIYVGDVLRVFVMKDSEDRIIATTKTPYAIPGEFARLTVVSVSEIGAFLDWGLDKDLFCPIKEQMMRMRAGQDYLVRIYIDEVSERIACTSKFNRYLKATSEDLEVGQAVKLMIADRTEDFIRVIINGQFKGSLFPDEWIEKLQMGEVRSGYIKRIRPEDGRIAVSLRPQGFSAVLGERDRILAALKEAGGTLPVSDKSSPEEIQRRFGLSKGAFKKLIGALYREEMIEISDHWIKLKSSG